MKNRTRQYSKFGFLTLLLTTLAISSTVEASPRFRIVRPTVDGSANIQRLLQATDHVVRADSLQARGRKFMANNQLRIASYRMQIVKAVLVGYKTRGAKQALGVAIAKTQDPYLPVKDKISIAIDCLGVAITELAKNTVNPITGAKLTLTFVQKITPCNYFLTIESALQETKTLLLSAPMYRVRQALNAIDVAILKVTDPYLSANQKQFYVLDCVNVAQRSL